MLVRTKRLAAVFRLPTSSRKSRKGFEERKTVVGLNNPSPMYQAHSESNRFSGEHKSELFASRMVPRPASYSTFGNRHAVPKNQLSM